MLDTGGGVCFSWCKLDTSLAGEPITDILETTYPGTKAFAAEPRPKPTVRELGVGRGASVCGLKQVPLQTSFDVESIIHTTMQGRPAYGLLDCSSTTVMQVLYPETVTT